ncbi:closca [Cochliomyia hominivorax]
MCYKFYNLLTVIILIINIKSLKTFNVNFHYNYNLQAEPFNSQIYKRELTQFFDKASFSLNGFEKVESVPVLFPIDICVFNLEGFKYATTLHMNKNGARHFKVFKMNNGSYDLIADIASPNAIAMDCINFNNKGYVAIAFNLSEPVKYAKEGSPIYEIVGDRLKAVQYFAASNLLSVFLRVSGNDFFLLHTYANSQETPNLHCPYFKWSGSTFNKMGRIPCSNARQLVPFSIDYESFVAVANYANQKGRTATNSEIYKYARDKKKFILFQKIKTNGAVDVQYFSVLLNEVRRQHFLVFGNSISSESPAKKEKAKREGKNLEADSVFYLFDKGQFIPYQKLSFYAVKKFLPVQNVDAEKFILLVACTDQDIKIYNLNDWKFEESKIQFTEGALGKGVANMRIYQEQDKSYLIIANELMADNETNIFLPIFQQEEHANALRQQIIDWAKEEIKRLETINVKDLRNQVEEKLKNLRGIKYSTKIKEIPQANIQTVITKSLIYPKFKMDTNYWTALKYINQALDTLEILLKEKSRNKRQTDPNNYENLEYVFDSLNVNTLKINKNLKVKRLNEVNCANPVFESINAEKLLVNKKPAEERFNPLESLDYMDDNDVMSVRNLQIKGKLNEFLWSDLVNNTLKHKQELQFLKAPLHVETLKTDTVIVNNDKVNEQNLGVLIPIDGGKYVINQDIQFAAPITANKVNILERLNNLHVFNNKFDVLLKKSNKTQVIEGRKNITNIRVLEPITIAGKMMGRQLESISPNKFINEQLVLQGNFMINGDVHINHQLNTLDLIDLKEKLSAKQVLDMGIRMDKSLTDVNLKFLQPLRANNSIISFVNQHDLQRLVKLNQDDIQIIEGLKIFNDSLSISRGFSEVKNLNGIDMEKLEKNAFLKHTNQTIRVPLKIGKITAKSIESPAILLNSKNISDYLTLTGNQSIQGSLIVDNLKTQYLTVEHLNTNSKIFHQHLQDIYQQKSRNAPQEDIFQPNRKFHGSIYVKNLILNTTINNKSVEDIENLLLQLEGNIKYVGNFKFNYPMNVTNMTFQGKLNGITAGEFGKCWLLKKFEKQVFTADQTFASVEAEEGITLQGKLNGFTMEDFYTKTYWINRDEYIGTINFENPIELTEALSTQTLNYYQVPEHVLYKNSKDETILLNSLIVDENVIVQGNLLNLTTVNDINLYKLEEFLEGLLEETLYVEQAYFAQTLPMYKSLNGHIIKNTLDSVWLANENVLLPHHVEMADARFEGLLEFEGPINNMNLDYLKENYFSKTKNQDVSIEMIFSEGGDLKRDLKANEIQVFGNLIEGKSGTPINFNEFVQNTLKFSGPHTITGNWTLLEAVIQGNLHGVLINQLNLVDDIVHTVKTSEPYHINAPKSFKSLKIENLYTDSTSLVNNVPVAQWIKDTVYLYENYTISGTNSIDSINIYNNLIVMGKLNNITFNEQNLLLQNLPQQIKGHLKIISYLPQEKRFLTNNIENLYTDYINHQYMPTFMENLVPATTSTQIKSHLIFKHVFKVEKYEGPEGFLTQNQWSKRDITKEINVNRANIEKSDEMFNEFKRVKDYLKNVSKTHVYKLQHFNVIQTFDADSAEVITLNLDFETKIVDILVIFDMRLRNVTIYEWLPHMEEFKETKDFNWLPQDPFSLKIIQKRFNVEQRPINVEYLKIFLQQELKKFYKVLSARNEDNANFKFINATCLVYEHIMALYTYCLNNANVEKIIKLDINEQKFLLINQSLATLTNSSVVVYNTSSNPHTIIQKLPAANRKEMTLGTFKNFTFLAVLNNAQVNSLNKGFVEIYRSSNSSVFNLFQSLESVQPKQIKFSYIEKSNDFLLHILTDSSVKPYLIYQYQGIMGFQELLSDSILPTDIKDMQLINLYSSQQYLVALIGKDKVSLMEIVLS